VNSCLGCLFRLSGLFRATDHLNQTNEINQKNQINQIPAPRREIRDSCRTTCW
jgi:hypothetical protein